MPPHQYYLPQRRLVSQQDAALIQSANVPRSRFLNTWFRLMTFDAGYIVPFMVDELLPGDHVKYNITAMVRMETPLFPIFMNQRVDTFIFVVPIRLLWTNFVKFMGEQVHPTDSIAFVTPQITSPANGYAVGSLYDHMGLATVGQLNGGATVSHQSLPLRAYNQIFNAWFRDENLTNSVADNRGDGPDNNADYVLQLRAKAHDYFTTLLPWAQKFTAQSAPLAGTAPVIGIGVLPAYGGLAGPILVNETPNLEDTSYANYFRTEDPNAIRIKASAAAGDAFPQIYADLTQATGININTLRQAFMVQALVERDARGGTRYTEIVKSHFGVNSPDSRLQRPEYIGGGKTPLSVTPIAQTAPTTGVPLGALGGAGTAAGTHGGSYAATEHCYVIGLINVRSELAYQQGMHRMWFRNTRYDFYWPALAGMGEQAVLKREIYITGGATDADVMGYQERWHEYRDRYSEVTGLFKSTSAGNIDEWHLAQQFTAVPSLNDTFIRDTPPMTRVLAAGAAAAGMQYKANILINRNIVRPIPTFGTPALLGRF